MWLAYKYILDGLPVTLNSSQTWHSFASWSVSISLVGADVPFTFINLIIGIFCQASYVRNAFFIHLMCMMCNVCTSIVTPLFNLSHCLHCDHVRYSLEPWTSDNHLLSFEVYVRTTHVSRYLKYHLHWKVTEIFIQFDVYFLL